MIPIDCSNTTGAFGGGFNAVRNLWWFTDGFYNVTGEWDPLNTINNAYTVDMIQFEYESSHINITGRVITWQGGRKSLLITERNVEIMMKSIITSVKVVIMRVIH